MNQDQARHSVFKFFSAKYAEAKDDSNVVKVEHFSGSKLDMEVSILKDIRSVEGDRNLAISIHAYKGHDKAELKNLLGRGWAPDGWVCKDIKLGQDNGVVVRFFSPFDWRNLNNCDLEGLLKGYQEIRSKIDPCIVQNEKKVGKKGKMVSGKGVGDALSNLDEPTLKKCFQVYLKHKKLLDLIRVCQKDSSSQTENKKWTNDECHDAVDRFQKKVKNIDKNLSGYLDCNVFDILRMGEHEIRHSNMLAWLLDATETHRMGNEFLSSFLNEVVEVAKGKGNGVCEGVVKMVAEHDFGDMSDYKVFREDEHEDIKLMSESAKTIVVIENKWNAEAGENQLTKYRERTDAECKDYGAGWEAIYVFLTKDGERPEKDDDDHWIPISYRQIITMVLDLYGRMAEGSAQKMIVDQYLQVLKRDADLIQQDDQVVQDVKKFCKDCDAIRFLPFVGEEYFQRVFDGLRNRDKRQWVRDEELDAGRGTCIVFFCEELRLQLVGARYEYCLELELDRTYSRVCCNLLRKVGGKKKREAVRWNCAKNEHGEPIQKTNVKNWKKFDINSTVPARMLEHMAENAIASVIEEVSRGVKCGPEIVDKW